LVGRVLCVRWWWHCEVLAVGCEEGRRPRGCEDCSLRVCLDGRISRVILG
jgi:hypothetical protein